MTNELFFDTDCLSAFLWINDTNILHELYGGKKSIGRGEAGGILITEAEGNTIWSKMLAKKRKLPANTFSEYIINKQKDK